MSDFTRNMAPINRAVLEALKPMGRMDGDGAAVEITDPRGRIAQLELEVQRLGRANDQLQAERDKLEDERWQLRDWATQIETQFKAGRQCVVERDKEIEQLKANGVEWEKAARLAWAQLREQPKADPAGDFNRGVEAEIEALRIIIKHMAPLI